MLEALIEYGFFPNDAATREKAVTLNPYQLRAEGLDRALDPIEFARALFHLNQRRGFASNRKTDSKENDAGALKAAIKRVRDELAADGDGHRTVGEWLWQRYQEHKTVRGRYREKREPKPDGKTRVLKSYDLYVDRAMVAAEFDALWAAQGTFNPSLFNETARQKLRGILLFQRPLKPVLPGRCTFIPDEPRAPLALPSTQRFRILQEANNLRLLDASLQEKSLTLDQRNAVADALERHGKRTFAALKKLLGMKGSAQFNLEDVKREELKGNSTSAVLSKPEHFGDAWFSFSLDKQDDIVMRLVTEQSEETLVTWLVANTGIDETAAELIARAGLPEGYGSLSRKAFSFLVPELEKDVIPVSEAAVRAGKAGAPFSHHSALDRLHQTGELLDALPYYGEALTRHVGFADPQAKASDPPEKRFGRIPNPTVHIGLNQVRLVVNKLIDRYGPPSQVIVELARDLKQSRAEREADQ
jgi:CRISPR-associated endonuclease Csn1